MIEIKIEENDSSQRFDRFLRKYLEKAPLSVIQKNIRKKNFKINGKRAKAEDMLETGDIISMYIKDTDYENWKRDEKVLASDFDLNIVYEDDNILVIDKPSGILTHAASKEDYGNNIVDSMLSYLYKSRQVNSRDKSFVPALVNRLDRNTAGLVIGAKNAKSLRALNEAIRERKINKYYLTLVSGKITKDFVIDTNVSKNESENRVKSSILGKRVVTKFYPIESNDKFSLLECELITGKTHQIRFSLKKNGTPILGDKKYGNESVNRSLNKKARISSQCLLAYKVVFGKIDGLEYLEGKEVISNQYNNFMKRKKVIFNEV